MASHLPSTKPRTVKLLKTGNTGAAFHGELVAAYRIILVSAQSLATIDDRDEQTSPFAATASWCVCVSPPFPHTYRLDWWWQKVPSLFYLPPAPSRRACARVGQ